MPQELYISDSKIKSSKCNLNQCEIYIRQTEIACIFATCFCDVKLHARHTCKKKLARKEDLQRAEKCSNFTALAFKHDARIC